MRKTRIILVRFDDAEWAAIGETRLGHSEFTVVRNHTAFDQVQPPIPCIVVGGDGADAPVFLGLITSKAAVATLQTRIKIRRCVQLQVTQAQLLQYAAPGRERNDVGDRLARIQRLLPLGPKSSLSLIAGLINDDATRNAARVVGEGLDTPKKYTSNRSLQLDGIRTALKAFGLDPNASASLVAVGDEETAISNVNVLEDSVVEHSARSIDGFQLINSEVTGKAVFSGRGSTLEVYTANKRPLEEVFGVDLIYYNQLLHSVVMIQFKILDEELISRKSAEYDWIYRPDSQLDLELDRMRHFRDLDDAQSAYRLNADPFWMKFVRRNSSIGQSAMITTVDHFDRMRKDPVHRGPRGGVRISYEVLKGSCLHEHGLMDLIRSGYIGSRGTTSDHFKTLIDATLENDRSVVAAIKKAVNSPSGASAVTSECEADLPF